MDLREIEIIGVRRGKTKTSAYGFESNQTAEPS